MLHQRFTAVLLGLVTTSLGLGLMTPTIAEAGILYEGWNYAIDSPEDSLGIGQVGGTDFELYGMAFQQTQDRILMAFKSNMPLGGIYDPRAYDKHIGYSDLIFNFTGENLSTANANGDLLGVRFAANNDSNAPDLGVYANVTAMDKAAENDNPQGSLQGFINSVNKYGKTASIGDLAVNDPYFDLNSHIPTLMDSVTLENRVGDIEMLTNFNDLGLNFEHFGIGGNYNYGFSFASSLVPEGDFIAHLSLDCNNDHLALVGTVEPEKSVPEPSLSLALAFLGFLGIKSRFRNK